VTVDDSGKSTWRRLPWLFAITVLISGCGGPVVASPSLPGAPSSPTPSPLAPSPAVVVPIRPGEPWIAYLSLAPGAEGLSVVRPDGSDSHRVLANLGVSLGYRPDWSPDGLSLAFVTDFKDIWLARIDGSGIEDAYTCADPCMDVDHPAISPDGRHIAFERNDTRDGTFIGTTIEILDLDTGAVRTAIASRSSREFIKYPRWSPDGRRLVVSVERVDEDVVINGPFVQASASAIAVADVSGPLPAPLSPLTDASLLAAFPDWNPVDGRIVFATYDLDEFDQTDEPSNLYTIGADGTGLTQLTHYAAGDLRAGEPSWTPDGKRITFTILDDLIGDRHIAFLDAEGTITQIVDTSGLEARLRPTP